MTKRSASVTIRDVARQAGVSVATVSRYLNQNAPVSEELSNRIQQVMDELDYVPHATARQLATHRKNTVGLLLTSMHNDFFMPLLAGIEAVVRDEGYSLLVATHQHPEEDPDFELPLGQHNTDGLMVFADSLDEEQLARIHRRHFPLVLIHRTSAEGYDIPFVTIENKAATCTLIEHLITVHHRRHIILMQGPAQQEDSYWREVGFKQALAAHQIAFDEKLVLRGGFERAIAYEAMRAFLADPDHPYFDAIFAGDDDAAVGVYQALQEAGLRIPYDVSVVGFDDSRVSPYLAPALTTVRAPTEAVGRSAARQLFRLLNGKPAERVTLHPTEIVLRHSCGCHLNGLGPSLAAAGKDFGSSKEGH